MTKNIIIMIATLILISSCSQDNEKKTTNENMLLAQEVSVSCVAVVDNQDTPDWTKGFNRLDFFKTVYKKAMSGKPFVYGDAALRDTINRKVFSANEIEKRMKSHVDTLDFDLLKEIRTLEKWGFDGTTLKFSKDVTAWVPIKIWEENGKTKKQQIFYVYPENQEKGKLIAKNIFYQLPWDQQYPNIYNGFDQINFLKHIINGIKSGDINAYDPIYMVDKSKRKFTPEQLKEYLGRELKSDLTYPYNPTLSSILFEEDWYFDENSLGITKIVKSIAFVWRHVNPESGEWTKKIMFFIFPK